MTKMICGSFIAPIMLSLPAAALAQQDASIPPGDAPLPSGEVFVVVPVDRPAEPAVPVQPAGDTGLTPAQYNAELTEIVRLCPAADPDSFEFYRDRYGRFYRELRAIRDDLREEMGGNGPTVPGDGAKLREMDDWLEALPHPSSLQCGPTPPRVAQPIYNGDPTPRGFIAAPSPPSETDLGDGHAAFERAADELIAEIYASFRSASLPSTGIGFQRDGAPGTAPEKFGVQSPDRIDLWGGGARVSYGGWSVDGYYAEGSGDASEAVPDSSGSGTVYGGLSPGGSSGISTPFGLNAEIETDVREIRLRLERALDVTLAPRGSGDPSVTVSPFAEYYRLEAEYRASASGSGTSGGFLFDFSQDRQQRLTQDHYGAGVRLDARWETSYGLSVELGVEAGAYLYEHELDSLESNRNNFTGAPDGSFTVAVRHQDSGAGFSGLVTLGFYWDIADHVELGVTGSAGYRSRGAAVFNPNSGDQVFFDGLGTDLDRQDLDFAGVGIGLRIGL